MDTTTTDMLERVRVFGTYQTIEVQGHTHRVAPFVTDHTQAVIEHMTAMRMDQAIRHQVMMNTLDEMAALMNKRGRGLYADRTDLMADGVSLLALAGWPPIRMTIH